MCWLVVLLVSSDPIHVLLSRHLDTPYHKPAYYDTQHEKRPMALHIVPYNTPQPQPYELLFEPSDLVRRFEALGDAAALLAWQGSYREMPEKWVMRQLDKATGFRVVSQAITTPHTHHPPLSLPLSLRLSLSLPMFFSNSCLSAHC